LVLNPDQADIAELMANNSSVRRFVDGTATSNDTNNTWETLQSAVNHWQIEFATLVNAYTGTILANGNLNRSSQYFDPSSLVEAVVQNNERVICSIVMTYEEFAKEGAPRFL
jgi:hypothetical protein